MQNRIKVGQTYQHFKGRKYVVLDIVQYSEDEHEKIVIYQGLYAPFPKWARPLSLFESEVDHKKYPDVKQKYRFQKIEI